MPTSGSTQPTRRRCARSPSGTADPAAAYGFRVHRMVGDGGELRPRRPVGLPDVRTRSGPAAARGDPAPGAGADVDPAGALPEDDGADPAPRRQRRRSAGEPASASTRRPTRSGAGSREYTSPLLEKGMARPWHERPAGLPVLADPLALGRLARPRGARPRGARVCRRSSSPRTTSDDRGVGARGRRAGVPAAVRGHRGRQRELGGRRRRASGLRRGRGDARGDRRARVSREGAQRGRARRPRRLRLVPRLARPDRAGQPRAPDARARAGMGDGHRLDREREHDAPRLGLLFPGPLERAAGAPLGDAGRRARALLLRAGVPVGGRRVPRGHARGRGHGGQQRAVAPRPPRLPRGGIRLTHHSPCSTVPELVRHHFARGRALGRILRGDFRARTDSRKDVRRSLSGYSRRRLADTDQRVADWGEELAAEYRRARPLVRLGIEAAKAGAHRELLAVGSGAREQARDRRQGEPPVAQAGDDPGKRVGGDAVGSVVQDDDRTRSG